MSDCKQGYKLADGSWSSEYKIGDKFEVVCGSTFTLGIIVEFEEDDGSSNPSFSSQGGGSWYCSWKFLKPYKKQFTQSDLLDGMRVVYRSGEERIVFGDFLYEVCDDELSPMARLGHFEDDLTCLNEPNMDIMKVIDRDGTVLYTRKETPTKSPAQIELDKLHEQIAQLQ